MRLDRRRFLNNMAWMTVGGAIVYFLGSYFSAPKAREEDLEEARIIPDVPRDAIPPLDSPKYVKAEEARWLKDDHMVVGYENNGDSRAYPILLMNWHEIVNDIIGGKRVCVTYCPLTYTGMVFDPVIEDKLYTFGNSGALFESNLVMYDKQTESYWWQVGGKAIKGELKGRRLKLLPSLTTAWKYWKKSFPDTQVLSRETGYIRPYDTDPYRSYNVSGGPAFPVSVSDERLHAKEIVLGVELDGIARAYPLKRVGSNTIVDMVGKRKVLILSDVTTKTMAAYEPISDSKEGAGYVGGSVVNGPLRSKHLKLLPAFTGFWFAWVSRNPKTELYPV